MCDHCRNQGTGWVPGSNWGQSALPSPQPPQPKAGWVCPTCERAWAWWFPGPCDHGKVSVKEDER